MRYWKRIQFKWPEPLTWRGWQFYCWAFGHKWTDYFDKSPFAYVPDRYCTRCHIYHRYAKHKLPAARSL